MPHSRTLPLTPLPACLPACRPSPVAAVFLVNARTLAMASLACAMVYLCESGTLDYQWVRGGEGRGVGSRQGGEAGPEGTGGLARQRHADNRDTCNGVPV